MGVIDEVKQRTDIVDIAGQYTKLTKAGRNFRGLCPLHSEKNPSFYIYPEQQSWHCFGACNTGGDVFSLVMKKQGLDFGESLRLLAQRAGVIIPSRTEAEGGKKDRLYQINGAASEYFHNLLISSPTGEKARNYVASRGLSVKTITDFQLGFAPNKWEALKQHLVGMDYTESELLEAGLIVETEEGKSRDRFRNRLIFPIQDSRGHTIGFGARALDDSMPKYLNSPQTPVFDKSSTLYALNLALPAIKQQDTAIIVEGYTDTITAHQNDFNNVIATMGTAVTDRQITSLKKITKNVILALDADAAGEEAMLRCVDYENTLGAEIKITILPQGKDPDDVIKENTKDWQRLLKEALPVVDYAFDKVATKHELTTAKGKTNIVDELMPIISEIKNAVRQDHYLNKLSHLAKVSRRSLDIVLGKIKSTRRPREMKLEVLPHVPHPVLSEPIEEDCLALLLQHPELKTHCQDLSPEHFTDTKNRQVFLAYKQAKGVKLTKKSLDSALYEYIDYLTKKKIPVNQTEKRLNDYILRLREKYLRSLQDINTQALDHARESGGSKAEIAKLIEQGLDIRDQLAEIFAQRQPHKALGKGG